VPLIEQLLAVNHNQCVDLSLRNQPRGDSADGFFAQKMSLNHRAIQHDESVSDILQVWLDVSNHPARGKDQANLLRKRVLSQILDKARA